VLLQHPGQIQECHAHQQDDNSLDNGEQLRERIMILQHDRWLNDCEEVVDCAEYKSRDAEPEEGEKAEHSGHVAYIHVHCADRVCKCSTKVK